MSATSAAQRPRASQRDRPHRTRIVSRRHRRLFWSLGLLAAAGFLGIVLGLMFYRAHVPETYRPGEDSADITHDLDRYAVAAVSAGGVENAGGLRNLSHALPAGAPAPRFTDVTRQAGLGEFRSFAGNRTSQLPEDMGSGVAWGDFDNDGNEDVFVVSAGGALDLPASQLAPSMLFRNLGNGKFQKVENFPDTRIIGMAAAWADYNNDGWLDLVVTGYDSIILFRNEHGVLVRDEKFPSPKGFWTGAAWETTIATATWISTFVDT